MCSHYFLDHPRILRAEQFNLQFKDGGTPNGSNIHAMAQVLTHKGTDSQEYCITVLSSQNKLVGCPLGVPISY